MLNCHNTITVISQNTDALEHFIDNRILEYFQIQISYRSATKIIANYQSSWTPPINWLCDILNEYPSCWIKNSWHADDGTAGIWIGCIINNEPLIQQMNWQMPQE